MQTIYCISGLGADANVFRCLDLSFAKPVFVKWISPLPEKTLSNYALRLQQEYIHDENPVILGLSLGGMIAVEITKSIPGAKSIIISSAKTADEIPYYWKMFQYVPVYKFLPAWIIKKPIHVRNYFLGATSHLTKDYVRHVTLNADEDFYKWAIGAILSWENKTVPENVVHIHGINDRLLPYKFVKPDISISNGGHLMIMENAAEISALLQQICYGNKQAERRIAI